MDEHATLAGELRQLLELAAAGPVPLDQPGGRSRPLWELGLNSAGYLTLLSSIEDQYGITWSLDEPATAFASFDSLLAHVRQKRSG